MQNNREARRYYVSINGEQIFVTEEVYRAYYRPVWREDKRLEREKRCRDAKGNRCTRDCSKHLCDRTGTPVSLDQLKADGFEVADPVSVGEIVEREGCLAQLHAAVGELEPQNRQIITGLFFEGKTERHVATQVGLSQKGVNKRKQKIFAQLQENLKDFA